MNDHPTPPTRRIRTVARQLFLAPPLFEFTAAAGFILALSLVA